MLIVTIFTSIFAGCVGDSTDNTTTVVEDTIRDTLKSVISQNYSDIEYLVIDGGSNDKTTDIIKEYISDIDYFISEKDNGMYDALNKGILAAQGSYIGQLHSDDIFANDNVISNLVSKINNYHNVQGVYSCLLYTSPSPRDRQKSRMPSSA